MKPRFNSVRLSLWGAEMETGISSHKISVGLRHNKIKPRDDGKYSIKDIITALSTPSGLETQAKTAKLQRIIDEAEIAKIEREVQCGKVASLQFLKDYAADIFTQTVTFIRHSKLSDAEKRQLIEQLRATEFVPRKVVPYCANSKSMKQAKVKVAGFYGKTR
jgi:hypothetical protein